MSHITLEIPLEISRETEQYAKSFMQLQLNRLGVGELRYGPPHKRKKYLTRLKKELAAYEKSGNAEHLLNLCNYGILEWTRPEHPDHHWNAAVDSVTRK